MTYRTRRQQRTRRSHPVPSRRRRRYRRAAREDGRAPATVVKVGGARLRSPEQLAELSRYVRHLTERRGHRVVLVHGGGPEIGELHRDLEVEFRKRGGLRVTSEESMPLVTMVLRGLINTRVVARLVADGVPAVGLSGVDLGLLQAQFLNRDALGRVGGPPRVQSAALRGLIEGGSVPVISPVCLGPDGEPVNVNADTVAHAVAAALRAGTLEFVSDVPGVRTADDTVAHTLSPPQIQRLLASSTVRGGMIPKLQAAMAAVSTGVGRVRVGDLNSMTQNTATEVTA